MRILRNSIPYILAAAGLVFLSSYSYLLFHGFAESFGVIISTCVFILAWNSREYMEDDGFTYLGIAYLAVSALDLLHIFSYEGMGVFPPGRYYANQLWIVARFIESCSLLGFSFAAKPLKFRRYTSVLLFYAFLTSTFIIIIFPLGAFPECYIQGIGQTSFKKTSEYVICLILGLGLFFLRKNRDRFDPLVYQLLFWSILITILEELSFTLYISNFGFLNLIGHLLKITSFYLVYKAIVETGLKRPYSIIFSQLKKNEVQLREAVFAKDRFFSILAHDLRNSLGGIAKLTKYIKEESNPIPSADMDLMITALNDTAQNTYSLLENLLTWARNQSDDNTLHPGPVNISFLAQRVLREQKSQIVSKNLKASENVPQNLRVLADEAMLEIVLRNLVTNAVKFSLPGGSVHIDAENHGGKIAIRVEDSGIGMGEDRLSSLFQIHKIKSTRGTANEAGSGFGLVLCSTLISKNNGRIFATSVKGQGSVFTVELPESKLGDS